MLLGTPLRKEGVIVYSPLQSGLLTGTFTAERAANLPEGDWRRTAGDFTSGLAANLRLAEALRDRTAALADGAAHSLMTRHADRTRPVAVRPLAMHAAAANAAAIRVRWRHGLIATVEHREGRVALQLPDRRIDFPGECADVIAALHRGDVVGAVDAPGLDAADGEVVIRRLLREAVVVPVPPPNLVE